MSVKHMLLERLGPRGRVQAIDRVPSGSPERLRLRPMGRNPNTPGAAVLLARRHLTLQKGHAALTRMLDDGEVLVEVPVVEDLRVLVAELAAAGIAASLHEPPETLDVKAIREVSGASQEEFALRYGLDVATLRNWEQGRSRPDTASRTVLWLIATRPEVVLAALDRPVEPA